MSGPVTTGSLLNRTFSLFAAGLVPFLAITFLFHLPQVAVQVYYFDAFTDLGEASAGGLQRSPFYLMAMMGLGVLLTTLGQAALIYGVFNALRGEAVTVNECLRVALSRWLAVLLLAIVIALATTIGFLMCFVPGFIVICGVFVAVPALVVEKLQPIDAFNRSWALTDGYKLTIFGVVLVLWLIDLAVGLLQGQLSGLGAGVSTLVLGFGLLVGIVTATLKGVAAGVTYYDLRVFREGLDEDELAAVFD